MKIDNGKYKFEQRKKRYVTPMLYMFAEMILVWQLLSVINVSFEISTWKSWSYVVFVIAFAYSTYKTIGIYDRQKDYERA